MVNLAARVPVIRELMGEQMGGENGTRVPSAQDRVHTFLFF